MRDDWKHTTLGKIASLTIGKTPPRNDPRYWTTDLDRPFCTIADMTGLDVTPKREGVTALAEKEGKAKRVPAGTLLMSFKLTIGRVGFAAVDLFPNEAIVGISVETPEVDPRYLALWLSSQDLAAGSGRAVKGNTLNGRSLRSIKIVYPPLSEQKRIVDLVDAFDAASEATAALEAAADVAAEALFADFLAHPEPTWEHVTLADVADVTMGRQRSPKHQAGDHPVAYLRAANVKDGRLVLDDVLKMNFALAEQRKYSLRPGDVLVTEGCGSLKQLGASASWNGELEGTVCFQNTLLRLRAKEGRATPDFVRLWARHAHHAGIWARIASGTNIFHIGATRASQLPLVVPPLDQQAQITNLVQATYGLSSAASTVARTRATARSELVRALLSGRHAIPESYDELLAQEV